MMTNQSNSSNSNQSNQTNSSRENVNQTVTNQNSTQPQSSSILIASIPSLTATASAIAATSTSSNASNSENKIIKANNNGTALIEMIMCKLVTPFHVINDPRLLECGSSACFDCIMSVKDNDRNLKCPYCNGIHKISVDTSKLISNKNLQTFLKINFADLNQNFNKQLEDSMSAFEHRIQTQNIAMENFDNYLNIVQNDVQMKIESMKNQLEKYAEQFIENIKVIRKEVQKHWTEHSSPTFASPASINTANTGNILITTNQNLLNLNAQQLQPQAQQIQISKDKTFQIIGIKNESLIPGNLNVLTLLNSNNPLTHSTYQLTNTFTTPSTTSSSNSTPTSMASLQTTNPQTIQQAQVNHQQTANNLSHHQHNDQNTNNNNSLNKQRTNQNHNDALNTSLDVLTNTFNFSNSSSWNGNDDDLEDFDTELNLKTVPTNLSGTPGSATNQKRHLNKEQAQFNKFVREEVTKKFGDDFLLQHEVNQLESSIMELIKSEAIASFLPKDTTPARAWTLAKVSLRSLKRDLRRKQGLSSKKDTHDGKMVLFF